MKIINEGNAEIKVPEAKKISKEMGVFYNPIMSLNRDISVLVLNSLGKSSMQIADPLAATGIRSIRFLKEIAPGKIRKIYINDHDTKSIKLIRQNIVLNKIKKSKIKITNEDANLFLLNSRGFDYIDIDPFGTPNPFLDAACKRIAREGILAVTATDTSALCGTYIDACRRKYWALPNKDSMMHETGLRILIRKIQLAGAQYDKALIPIFSYSKEHYMRVFLRNEKGKNKADELLKLHGIFNNAGPMWTGNLWDKELASRIYNNAMKTRNFRNNKELMKFLETIKEESKTNSLGFYDLHDICEKNKIKNVPKKEAVKIKIRKSGHYASDTHFKGEGIRSDIGIRELIDILKKA